MYNGFRGDIVSRKDTIMEMRVNRLLKGKKPCFIYMRQNKGEIYMGGQSDFIMTITDNFIHFQKLSFFLRKYQPKGDLKLDRKSIKYFTHYNMNIATNTLILYTVDKKFIQVFYNCGVVDTIETENNISDIINLLKEQGVKEKK